MKVTVHSREEVETIIRNKAFPSNTAVISFYDPPDAAPIGYREVDYPSTVKDFIYVAISDLDWDSFEDRPDEMILLLNAFFEFGKRFMMASSQKDVRVINYLNRIVTLML